MDAFFAWLGPEKSGKIRLAVMDMWKAFRNSTLKAGNAPQTAILYKFHVLKHLGEALDKVRKQEYAGLSDVSAVMVVGTLLEMDVTPALRYPKPSDLSPVLDVAVNRLRSWAVRVLTSIRFSSTGRPDRRAASTSANAQATAVQAWPRRISPRSVTSTLKSSICQPTCCRTSAASRPDSWLEHGCSCIGRLLPEVEASGFITPSVSCDAGRGNHAY